MSEESRDTERATAELNHFEGDFVSFEVLDDSGDILLHVNPYSKAELVPDDASFGDVFQIEYDTETEEIVWLEYDEDATKKQKARNAKKLDELEDDDVVMDSGSDTDTDS